MKEHTETITFLEFKDWLVNMIIEKGGNLPDYDDWTEIKDKIDRVDSYDRLILTTLGDFSDLDDNTNIYSQGGWGVDNDFNGEGNFNVTWEFQTQNYLTSPPPQMHLDFDGYVPYEDVITMTVSEESLMLGAELQQIIDEKANGQKESS